MEFLEMTPTICYVRGSKLPLPEIASYLGNNTLFFKLVLVQLLHNRVPLNSIGVRDSLTASTFD
jgi:hypothetical protein